LSSDLVNDLFEDRKAWVTTTKIDSFRDPRVVTFNVGGVWERGAVGVLASRDGTVWVANAGSLEEIKNGTVVDSKRARSPGDRSVHARRSSRESVDRVETVCTSSKTDVSAVSRIGSSAAGLILMAEDIDGDIWAVLGYLSKADTNAISGA
jgi:hypothetical protein